MPSPGGQPGSSGDPRGRSAQPGGGPGQGKGNTPAKRTLSEFKKWENRNRPGKRERAAGAKSRNLPMPEAVRQEKGKGKTGANQWQEASQTKGKGKGWTKSPPVDSGWRAPPPPPPKRQRAQAPQEKEEYSYYTEESTDRKEDEPAPAKPIVGAQASTEPVQAGDQQMGGSTPTEPASPTENRESPTTDAEKGAQTTPGQGSSQPVIKEEKPAQVEQAESSTKPGDNQVNPGAKQEQSSSSQASEPGEEKEVSPTTAAPGADQEKLRATKEEAQTPTSPANQGPKVVLRPASSAHIDWCKPVKLVVHLKKGRQKFQEARYPTTVEVHYTSQSGVEQIKPAEVLGTGKAQEPRVCLVDPGNPNEVLGPHRRKSSCSKKEDTFPKGGATSE